MKFTIRTIPSARQRGLVAGMALITGIAAVSRAQSESIEIPANAAATVEHSELPAPKTPDEIQVPVPNYHDTSDLHVNQIPEAARPSLVPPPPEAMADGDDSGSADQTQFPQLPEQADLENLIPGAQVVTIDGWTMNITPVDSSSGHPRADAYEDVYNSIPYHRAEYLANPGYRHDATMEILFGQLRPTVIHRQDTPQRIVNPQLQIYRPYLIGPYDQWNGRSFRYRSLYLHPWYPAFPY